MAILALHRWLVGPHKSEGTGLILRHIVQGRRSAGCDYRYMADSENDFAEAMGQPCPEDDDMEALSCYGKEAAAFLRLPSFLDLSNRTMSSSDFQVVAVSLAHAEDVDGLDISYCGLSDQHANLLRLHGSLCHIVSLFIAGNPTLHGAGLAMIASALEISGQLLYLDVTDCQLNANDSASLNEILVRNPVIDLTLDVNPLSAEFLRQLQPSLTGNRLRVLAWYQSRGQLDNEGARVVGEILAHCDHLEREDLRGNGLGNDGVSEVLRGAAAGHGPGCVVNLSRTNLDGDLVPFLSSLSAEEPPKSSICDTELHLPQERPPRPLQLVLHGNKISPRALQQLADQLPSSSRHWIECGQLAIRNGRLHWRDLQLLLLFRKYTKQGGKGTNIGIDDEVVAHAGGDSVARRPLPCGGTVFSRSLPQRRGYQCACVRMRWAATLRSPVCRWPTTISANQRIFSISWSRPTAPFSG